MSKAAELAALIGSQTAQGNKNLVKNGSMVVSQRATSSTSITTAGYYTVDRQYVEINNAGTWTMTQSDDVPAGEGFAKSFKYDCTTADTSLGTSHYFIHRYSIEGQDLQQLMYGTSSAKPVTISFFVKSNKTGTYVCELQQLATDGSFPRSGKAFTINSANTWEKKTVTINGNTAKFTPDSNARGMDIMIWLAAGTDFTSGTFNAGNSWTTTNNERVGALTVNIADSTANEILFTGLQMEIGEVATPFEHEDFATTLEKCQRYYFESKRVGAGGVDYGQVGRISNQVQGLYTQPLPTPLRGSPTITANPAYNTGSSWNNNLSGVTNVTWTGAPALYSWHANKNSVEWSVAQTSIASGYVGMVIQPYANTGQSENYISFDAEL